ncbi:hypothetical protein [Nonomuraea dietziae]|uniref:hypothetical protein n=1 Tax=Nonomuraea dietziae TaxID=65515 RepID=UPI003430CE78
MADASGWFALGGALGGGAIGVVTTALTHRWQARNAERGRAFEHEQHLRQERRETYAGYWTAWNSLIRTLERSTDGGSEARDRISAAEAEWRQTIDPMFIICSTDVLQAGIEHVKVTEKRISAALRGALPDGAGKSRSLSRAMRIDLGA